MAEAWVGWPGWEGAHPLLVHFPIAWLVAAAVALAVGLGARERPALSLLRAAVALLAGSAVAAILAVRSGEASAAVAMLPLGAEPVLARHQQLGTILLAAVVLLAGVAGIALRALGRGGSRLARRRRLTVAALLAATLGVVMLMAATAHLGGRLVHELGVRAWAPPEGTSSRPLP